MNPRDKLLELRPNIEKTSNTSETSEVEKFQNDTLRPILKFQNELLLSIYQIYTEKYRDRFYSLTINHREFFINESIQKDNSLKNIFWGTIIGQFTLTEYQTYLIHEKEFKKRISSMIIQRLQDQVGKFELV